MIKDLAIIVDGLTQKAGRYALSLTSLFDAHLTAISAVVELCLARSACARGAQPIAEMLQAARTIVDRISRLPHAAAMGRTSHGSLATDQPAGVNFSRARRRATSRRGTPKRLVVQL
jgi:hypothetical protein